MKFMAAARRRGTAPSPERRHAWRERARLATNAVAGSATSGRAGFLGGLNAAAGARMAQPTLRFREFRGRKCGRRGAWPRHESIVQCSNAHGSDLTTLGRIRMMKFHGFFKLAADCARPAFAQKMATRQFVFVRDISI
jgi:hypothetical protein